MFGSFARVSRLVASRPTVPAIFLIVGITLPPTDSTRRVVGFGVLPLPAVETVGDVAPLVARNDPILDLRHDARAERGRVLYAAGRAPANRTANPTDRTNRTTRTCRGDSTSRQVVQGRATGASPNS